MAFLEDYISLERIRYNERLKISFEKDAKDPEANRLIAASTPG
ncbi:MAG: hypothetical protein ACTHMV_08060 [Chitinophagaceae bacterium]